MSTLRIPLIALVLVAGVGCNSHTSRMLPREVEGVWITNDPRYGERSLDLSQAFVILDTGPKDIPNVQFVDRVETENEGANIRYVVYSTDYTRRENYKMVLEFRPEHGGEIRFNHQGTVWRRRQ